MAIGTVSWSNGSRPCAFCLHGGDEARKGDLRRQTFELSGRRRQDARPGLAKMFRVPPDRAWWPAVGAPFARGVRPRTARKELTQSMSVADTSVRGSHVLPRQSLLPRGCFDILLNMSSAESGYASPIARNCPEPRILVNQIGGPFKLGKEFLRYFLAPMLQVVRQRVRQLLLGLGGK